MKLLATLSLLTLLSASTNAQKHATPWFNKFSLGISAGHYNNDPGLMLTMTSPFFTGGKLAVRASGGLRWSENYFAERGSLVRYASLQTGMVYFITQEERIRVYGETGVNLIFPSHAFSDKRSIPGIHETLGMDFYIYSNNQQGIVYFFEIGITLNSAKAEKLEGQPRYSNGVVTVTGFRFHL